MRPQAVLLDRDGVINVQRPDHVKSLDEFELLPGAADAIARLSGAGIPVIVVTNQSVINRGLARGEDVEEIHRWLETAVERQGGRIDAVFCCPHRPEDGCSCRKPQPGLLLRAAERFQLDLARCVMVGDADSDVEAAKRAGCSAIRLGPGGPRDLPAAVASILDDSWEAR